MSQLNVVKNSVSADQIYFDVTVANFQNTTTVPPIFYYNEQRVMPFISNPEDYYLTIERFTMETQSLPVFIPSIQPHPPNNDVNKTIYSVTLEYTYLTTTFTEQVYVVWSPQDKSVSVPPFNTNGLQIVETGYYNCYAYSWFCYLVTQAFETAFNNLNTAVVSAGGTLPTVHQPILNWDSTSNSGVLYADTEAYDQNPTNPASKIGIYMNAPLFSLFNSFPAEYLGYTGVTLGRNYKLAPVNLGSTNLQSITPANILLPQYLAIVLYQECSTIAQWTPITSVVFTSNTLPINPNQVSTPLVYNESKQISLGGTNADIANIITDLVSDTGAYRPNLVYQPSAEFRRITLFGNRPLYNIDLQIYYRIKTGQLIPYRIGSGEAVTIKLAFLKKGCSR
jgi:hypothetical protein